MSAVLRIVCQQWCGRRDFSIYGGEVQVCQSFLSLASYGVNKVVFGPPYGGDWRDATTAMVEAWRNQP